MLKGEIVNNREKIEVNEIEKKMAQLQELYDNLLGKIKEVDEIIQETFVNKTNPIISGKISESYIKAWNNNLPDIKQLNNTFQFWQGIVENICSSTIINNEIIAKELRKINDDLKI